MRKVLAITCSVFISANVLGMFNDHKKNKSFVQNQLANILEAKDEIQDESINLYEATKSISLDPINQEEIPELIKKQKKLEQFLAKKHNELMNAILINKMDEVAQIMRDVSLKLYFTYISHPAKNPQLLDPKEIQKLSKIVNKNFDLFINSENNSPGNLFTGKTPLRFAQETKNMEAINYLLDYNVNIQNTSRHTPLIIWTIKQDLGLALEETFRKNKLEIVKKLLKRFNTDPNVTDKEGNTALFCAINAKDMDMTKLLIDNGANINLKNADEDTPLLIAARKNLTNLVELLIKHGADVNAKDKNGNTPLIFATKKRNLSVVKDLIRKEADINAKNNNGDSPLMLLIKKTPSNNHPPQNLNPAEREAEQERHTARQETPAARRARQERSINKFEIIKELLNNPNIDPNITDNEGNTALYYAISTEKIKVINALLAHHKTLINTKDDDILTNLINKINASDDTELKNTLNLDSPLIEGVCTNNLEKVKLFIKYGADVNARDENGDTLLIHACYYDYEIAEFLVEHGADINLKSPEGSSPLITAIMEERNDIVELLLQHDVNIEGSTIFDATRINSVPLAKAFLKKDPNLVNLADIVEENTPLHSACYNESFEVAKLLLENNADAKKENLEEETPLSIIKQKIQKITDPQTNAKAKEILQMMSN